MEVEFRPACPHTAAVAGGVRGVFGSAVKSLEGQRIGIVTAVIINRTTAKFAFVVIDVDGECAPFHDFDLAVP